MRRAALWRGCRSSNIGPTIDRRRQQFAFGVRAIGAVNLEQVVRVVVVPRLLERFDLQNHEIGVLRSVITKMRRVLWAAPYPLVVRKERPPKVVFLNVDGDRMLVRTA